MKTLSSNALDSASLLNSDIVMLHKSLHESNSTIAPRVAVMIGQAAHIEQELNQICELIRGEGYEEI